MGFVDDEMGFAGAAWDEVEAQDFGDDAGGFAGAINAVIGELVGRKTLCVECAEAGFVAEERAAGHRHAAAEQDFYGSIQPHDRHTCGSKKFWGALLGVGAAAESEHDRFFLFEDAAEGGTKLIGFDLAKRGLAEAFENFGDAQVGGGFNAVVEIDEAPGELAGEERADGGLAGAHEAGEAEQWYALLRLWWTWRLAHVKRIRLDQRLERQRGALKIAHTRAAAVRES